MDSMLSLPTFVLFITLNLLLFTQTISTSETSSSSHRTVPKSSVNTTWQSSNWENNTASCSGQSGSSCPVDALKLGVCVDLLGGLVNVKVGQVQVQPCCSLIQGLVDLDAAVCLCTAIKANNILGINVDVPVSLSLLLNVCSKQVPSGFQCY